MEDYKERARRRAQERQISIWWKLKEGDNTFRVLPTPETPEPEEGADKKERNAYKRRKTPSVFIEYNVHRNVGPRKQQVRCGHAPTQDMHDQECWICDVQIPKLEAKGQDTRAKLLAPEPVLAMQIAQVSEEGEFTGPFIFTPAKTVGDQILATVLGSKKRDYVDPKKGFNLTISRTGTGFKDTRYGMVEPDTDPSEVPSKMIGKLKPFSDLKELPVYSEEAQKAAYFGRELDEADTDDEDEDEDLAPRRGRDVEDDDGDEELVSKPRKKPVVKDEDEDEEENAPKPKKKSSRVIDDEDEQEAEDEAPKPKKKKPAVEDDDELDDIESDKDIEPDEDDEPPKKKKKVVVEDPEDVPDLEDDEDEAPVKKKGKKEVEEEPEEEEDEPPKRRAVPPPKKRR